MKNAFHLKSLALPFVLLLATGCSKPTPVADNVARASETIEETAPPGNGNRVPETMLFKSYFTDAGLDFTYLSAAFDNFEGANVAPYSWNSGFGGTFRMYYDEGTYADRRTTIVNDSDGDNILQYEIKNASVLTTNPQKARIQTDLYGVVDPTNTSVPLQNFYQQVNVRLDNTSFNKLLNSSGAFVSGDWLTLFEFWNNKNWGTDAAAKYPFRIGIGLKKVTGSPNKLNFVVNAEEGNYNATTKLYTSWGDDVWTATSSLTVPFNTWIKMEIYIREGSGSDKGEFWFAVTPLNTGVRTVIADKTGVNSNWTRHPDNNAPDGLTHWNPMKLYTSKNIIDQVKASPNPTSLKVFWDDIYIWKDRTP